MAEWIHGRVWNGPTTPLGGWLLKTSLLRPVYNRGWTSWLLSKIAKRVFDVVEGRV